MHARSLTLLLALALALTVATAGAQAPAGPPPPPGCAGISQVDPKDDAKRLEGATDAPDNFDITGLYFTRRDGKTFAVMTVQGPGGSTLPTGATGARWYIFFNKGPAEFFVRAGNITPDGETFEFGHTDPESATGQYVSDGDTPGRFGDGFLEMVVPAAIAKVGDTLAAPKAQTFERIGNRLFGIDEGAAAGKAYVVDKCESGGGGTTPPPSGGTTPPPSGGGTPPPSGGTPPPGSGGQPTPGTDTKPLQVSVAKSGKAKGKALTLAINSNSEVKNIKAVLKKGAKKVGKGALAKLNGKGKLKLKLAKKQKKGSYTLELTGTNADGRPGKLTVKVKLK